MNKTSIEWTHRPETRGEAGGMTWNPIRARLKGAGAPKARSGTFCTRISPGCTHCYASTINKRFGNGLEFTVPNLEKVEFFIDDRILQEPLKQKKPCTIFVGDMFDLFHEAIDPMLLADVLDTALRCHWHTFQFLTKRADIMRDTMTTMERLSVAEGYPGDGFPPKNFWLGVSVESQKYADERIPLLKQTPAAVRFLSVEPQLEAVNLTALPTREEHRFIDALRGQYWSSAPRTLLRTCIGGPPIGWVICGGESGPGARPFNLAWAESLLQQCRDAGVPFFMKQLGSYPVTGPMSAASLLPIESSKGGDPSEWPESLRVREFPAVREAVSA